MLRNDELARRIATDYRTAGLEPRRTAMLEYAEKLTREPATVARADVEMLRRAGFSDPGILAIAEVTSYFAYVNRIADGLGVALER